MGKYIPVEPEKWAEMVKALALVAEMDKTINASQAECRRLKEKSECQAECLEAFDKENARLKSEVERLSQPAVIGGYNLSQYIRMANSETLEFDNGDIFADMTLPERIKYIVESHARLKAEVEQLTKENETINKDRTLLWASHKIALQDIQRLHYALQTAKEGKQS